MSLTIRSTMNNQAAAQGLNDAGKSAENTGESKNRKTINASELNLKPYKDNQIDAKRLRARKQAMKLISDAWKSADKTDKNIDDMKPGIITVNNFFKSRKPWKVYKYICCKAYSPAFSFKKIFQYCTPLHFLILLAKYFKIISLLLNKCNIIRF